MGLANGNFRISTYSFCLNFFLCPAPQFEALFAGKGVGRRYRFVVLLAFLEMRTWWL
jgi:hypothetical protein